MLLQPYRFPVMKILLQKFKILKNTTRSTKILMRYTDLERPNKEAAIQRCSVKRVFLEIGQISQETPVPESLFQ